MRLLVSAGAVLAAGLLAVPFSAPGPPSVLVTAGPGAGSEQATAELRPTPTTIATPAPTVPPTTAPPAPEPPAIVTPPPLVAPVDPGIGTGVAPTGVATGDPLGAPFGAPAPPDAGPTPAASVDTGPGARVWAVVVAIDDYPGSNHDLRAAAADGRELVAGLLRVGVPSDHVRTVFDGEATVDGILDAVDWVVAQAGPDDTVVFLYAGHVRDFGGGTEAIITSEAGYITDWYLAGAFAGLGARDAWFIIAGCYGGGFDELLGPGRALTAGAGPGQLAYESDAYGRSYLAEYLLHRALVGAAAEPTVPALAGYAMQGLAADHPEHQLWHVDQAGHTISVDGVDRDTPPPSTTAPAPPSTEPPPRECRRLLLCG